MASLNCFIFTDSALRSSLRVSMTASRHTASISAPTYFSVFLARYSRSTSSASGMFLVCTLKISSRAFSSGSSTLTWRSNLPGLNRAGSIMSTLLVAAITATSCSSSSPSISVKSWLTTLWVTPLSELAPDRAEAMLSISSKNITVGAVCLALRNTSLTPFSDSPTHLDSSSGPLTAIKLA
ncbi:MAG: hypothetical protein A4E25_00431 [Methanobacterium sp. PtaB.Bin024]|nr:MAG: hypothetical protein A4E25_00431 [Methanobacterium sp. PtaB.Bin024]